MNMSTNTQKGQVIRSITPVFLIALQASMPLCYTAEAVDSPANNTAKEGWKKLQENNSHIDACRVSWKRVMVIKPNLQVDLEKRASQALEWARKEGFSEEKAQRESQAARREVQRDIQGQTVSSILNFVRVGKIIRCEVVYPDLQSKGIDFYDGTNSIFVETQVNGINVPKTGTLKRDSQEVLAYSAGKWQIPRFLLGIPLEQEFSLSNPALTQTDVIFKEVSQGNLSVEQKITPQRGLSLSAQFVLSKKHLRPLAYEVFNPIFIQEGKKLRSIKSSQPTWSVSVEGYKQFSKEVEFPSRVVLTTPNSTVEYTLLKAAFNEDVDPIELRLPADTRVADTRFGDGTKTAVYKLKNGVIPSDDEVRKMLNLDKEATQAKDAAVSESAGSHTNQTSSPIAPVAGLLFMALGGMMWVRSRQE